MHGLHIDRDKAMNYGLNKTGDLRILDNLDSTCNPNSYSSQVKARNSEQIAQKLKGYQNE